jgi:hypothetical protein
MGDCGWPIVGYADWHGAGDGCGVRDNDGVFVLLGDIHRQYIGCDWFYRRAQGAVKVHPPFVILALPRSMTAWTAKFLSYRDWHCGHEEIRHVRSLADVRSWLSQPCTGTVETAAAPYWRLLKRIHPHVRVATIRRPVSEVVESLMRLDIGFERAALETRIAQLNAKLDQIEARWPHCLSVRFNDTWDAHARLFEHCLPYAFDRGWYARMVKQNIQCSVPALIRYEAAFRPQLMHVNQEARNAMHHYLRMKRWHSR